MSSNQEPLPSLDGLFSSGFSCEVAQPLQLLCRATLSRYTLSDYVFQGLDWHAVDLGNCPKSESSRKWLGEGAKGLLDPASKRPLALVRNGVAPVQKRVWVVQKTLGRPFLPGPKRSQKDLLHPPLTTFGDFPFLGNFPGPQHPKVWRGVAGESRYTP